jgi:hypothetical protein
MGADVARPGREHTHRQFPERLGATERRRHARTGIRRDAGGLCRDPAQVSRGGHRGGTVRPAASRPPDGKLLSGPHPPARRGALRSRHRVHERDEPAAGPGGGAPARVRHPGGARGESAAGRTAAAHGGARARSDRRRAGRCAGRRDHSRAAAIVARRDPVLDQPAAGLARHRLRDPGGHRDERLLRPLAGAARNARGLDIGGQAGGCRGRGPSREPHPTRARGRAAGVVSRAARGRRAHGPQPGEPRKGGSRIPLGRCADLPGRAP